MLIQPMDSLSPGAGESHCKGWENARRAIWFMLEGDVSMFQGQFVMVDTS